MQRYRLVHPLWLSFYSKDLYQDAGRNWEGTGLVYLLFLLAVVWVAETFKVQAGFAQFVDRDAPAFVRQIPRIEISNGVVSVDAAVPYYIRDPQSGAVLAILDPSGEIQSLDNSDAKLLLTRNRLILKRNPAETRVYDLSGVRSFTINQEDVHHWLELARKWFAVAFYPFALLFSYVYRILQVLLYAAIGLLFASALKVQLGYATLLRLTVIAITPVVLLDTIHDLANLTIPHWWLICFAIAMGYLFVAVKWNAESGPPPEMPQPTPPHPA